MTSSMYAAGKQRSGTRDSKDRYETPKEITLALLDHEEFSDDVLEPACGTGRIVRALDSRGHSVTSFDLCEDGINFLDYKDQHANVVTNPPFMNDLHMKFVEHAYQNVATEKVSMLVPLTFLTTEKRYKFFQRVMPSRVLIIPNRIRFYRPVEDVIAYELEKATAFALDGDFEKYKKHEQAAAKLEADFAAGKFEPCGGVRIPSQTFNHCWITWDIGSNPEHPELHFLAPIPEQDEVDDLI